MSTIVIAASIYLFGVVVSTALISHSPRFRLFIEDWFSEDKCAKGTVALFWPVFLIFFAFGGAVMVVARVLGWIGGAYYCIVEHSMAVAQKRNQKRKEAADRRASEAKLQALRKRGETEKYEIVTDMVDTHHLPVVYRIRALRDIPQHHVKFGDIGGWVESEKNLSREGDAWIGDDACVFGDAVVSGDALVNCAAKVSELASVGGHAVVTGAAVVDGNAVIKDSAVVGDDAKVFGNAFVKDRGRVMGNARVFGNAIVEDDAMVSDFANVKDHARIGGNVVIKEYAEIKGYTRRNHDEVFEGDTTIAEEESATST